MTMNKPASLVVSGAIAAELAKMGDAVRVPIVVIKNVEMSEPLLPPEFSGNRKERRAAIAKAKRASRT